MSAETAAASGSGPKELLIIGTTLAGKLFRPSDWAERLCGVLSIFDEDQRINYSPYVKPVLSAEVKCVVVDLRLKALDPVAFEFLIGFARDNELKLQSAPETVLEGWRLVGAGAAA